jgi:hypothetical protein
MRALSQDLLAVQQQGDAYAEVTVRCKRRSTFAGDPLVWRPIFTHTAANLPYGDLNVAAAACSCAENGVLLRVLRSAPAHKVGVQRVNVLNWTGSGTSSSPAARTALTAAPAPVATLAGSDPLESTPGVGRYGNEIRIVYGDGAKLYQVRSLDDGRTWGTPAAIYDGGMNYGRFSNISLCHHGAAWLCVCNGYNAKRLPRVRALCDTGGGWAAGPELAVYGDWQVAGVRGGPEQGTTLYAYAYLWGVEYTTDAAGVTSGWNSLACQQLELTGTGAYRAWGTRTVVDRAGVTSAARYDRVRLGEGGGAYLFALQERAAAGYWFVSALYALPGNADMEEPVFLGDADGAAGGPASGGPAAGELLTPLSCGRRAWLVGAGQVWASAQSDAAVESGTRTYTPTSYRYEAAASGGGELTAELPRTVSAGAAIEGFGGIYPPEVYVGDMLWLDRTLSSGDKRGTQTIPFRVAAVRYTRAHVTVTAHDALGVLAHMRPRRAKVLQENDRLRMADAEAICHWAGLTTTGTGTLPQAVYPSPGFIWSANESGLGALRRYLGDQAIVLRAAGTDGAHDHTRVAFLPLPSASVYTYVSPEGWREELGVHEIADWEICHDGRATRLFVAVGLRAGASAVTGEAWAMAVVASPGGVKGLRNGLRPAPYVAVDRSMAWADGSLQARATAEAQRLAAGLPYGWIETTANLGIELYDVVTVDETDVRVVKIVETWERGRLRQRLDLAEVNAAGVYGG